MLSKDHFFEDKKLWEMHYSVMSVTGSMQRCNIYIINNDLFTQFTPDHISKQRSLVSNGEQTLHQRFSMKTPHEFQVTEKKTCLKGTIFVTPFPAVYVDIKGKCSHESLFCQSVPSLSRSLIDPLHNMNGCSWRWWSKKRRGNQWSLLVLHYASIAGIWLCVSTNLAATASQ